MLDSHAPNPSGAVSRRGLLAGAAAGGLATLLPAAASAATTSPPQPKPANAIDFFADPALNYSALSPIGAAAYGAAEPGEVLTVFNRVHARGDTYGAYGEEFESMGRTLAGQARRAAAAGRRVTARDRFLRAASYLNQSLFYVLASNRPTRAHEATVYREMESAFARAGALFEPAFQRVAIPYEKRTLPGWLLTPPGRRIRRPTLILNNGSDAQNVDMLVFGGLAARERGWNALIFEGPGQGSNLFLHGIPFRPDWERVITPVVDFLRRHPAVDRRRIMLSGSSFGGYLVARAAAFEHRLAGLVVDPGVTDAFVSWSKSLPPEMVTMLRRRERARFDAFWKAVLPHLTANERFEVAKRSEIYGKVSFYDQLRLAQRFALTAGLARRITGPVVVADPQDETFYPGQSQALVRWLTAHPARLLRFTISEGAQFHCEVMAPTVRNDAVLDWLEANLRPTR